MKPTCRLSTRRSRRIPAAALATALLVPSILPSRVRAQDQAPAAPPPAAAPATKSPAAAPAGTTVSPAQVASEQPVVQLSPFEVNASQDKGYFAANTLAGTRLNTSIGDLSSSVTVVTKQQMEDTNSLNINDVLRFEANTEGALTYTPIATFRGQVVDTLQGTGGTSGGFTSALSSGNRVRGLAAVDNEQDNFFSLSRIPFDAYNTESVEIDRGPNSIIYGFGSPSGIFNQSRSEAVLNKFSGEASLQGDSWGTFRETLNVNVPLLSDRLAIYAAQMYQAQRFEQKPSSDMTRRQYVALTLQPFKSSATRLKMSFENYNNYNNDPNFITPIDLVSPWLAAGRPVWNTLTSQVTWLNTGQTSQPYAYSTTMPNYVPGGPVGNTALTSTSSPYFVPGLNFFTSSHNIMFVNQGQVQAFYRGQQTGFTNTSWVPKSLSASQAMVYQERLTESTGLPLPYLANGNAVYGVWYNPGVTSKSVYDWRKINAESLDYAQTGAKTYSIDLQQQLLPTGSDWGSLNLDVAWFRQELKQTIDSPLSQAPVTTMYVDTNQYLPNGQPNPHLGQPFVDAYSSDIYVSPEMNNNWRGMLDWEVDPSQKLPSWLKWVGHHRFVGLFTQHDDILTNLRYRPNIYAGDPNYLPSAATLGSSVGYGYGASNTAIESVYYLGGGNGHATSGPGPAAYGQRQVQQINTYNYSTGQWGQSALYMQPDLYPTGGLSENLQDAKTYFWQGFLWNDRVVGLLGIDDDMVKNRNTILPSGTNARAIEYPNGFSDPSVWYREGPWSYVGGNTSQKGVVLHPFKNWSAIDNAADSGNYAAAFLRTLSFTYNKSDNFNPPAAFYTDFFGRALGKPAGQETDYGVEMATPDNKWFLRATWFKTDDLNQLSSTLTVGARANYMDQTLLKDWASAIVRIQNGEDPTTNTTFNGTSDTPLTATEQNQVAQITGLPYNYGGNVGANGEYVNPQETEDGTAKGIDLELEYNPLPNWTLKFTWGYQKTTVNNADVEAVAWLGYRYPTWQKYTSQLTQTYTNAGRSNKPMYLGNFWQSYGYDAAADGPGNIFGWTSTANYYNAVVVPAVASDTAFNGTLAPNQREYSWNAITNYTFDRGRLKGLGLGTALAYDGRATVGYYGSTTNLNANGQIVAPDTSRPIYTPAKFHVNLWASYQFKLPWSDLRAKVQFNVQDLTSNGYLLPITYNFDGSPATERIIPPRTYQLITSVYF